MNKGPQFWGSMFVASLLLMQLSLPCRTAGARELSPHNTEAKTKRRSTPIFVFYSDEFWVSLHHFLYVLGRAQNKTRDASREAVVNAPADQDQGLAHLKPAEQGVWREAVAWYAAGPSQKDVVFDKALTDLTNALVKAGKSKTLTDFGVDPATAEVLMRAAPIYRKAWWPAHHASNLAWRKEIESLVKKHGTAVLAFIEKAYQLEWPASGYAVHISGYTNWAGAYSTNGNLLVVSSLSKDIQKDDGLETVFHEGMHQWDEPMQTALREQVRRQQKRLAPGLSHALIFFTAGEAVRHVIPSHVRYADKAGVWQRGMLKERDALEEIWKPYLEGRGTRDEALAELVKRLGVDAAK